MPFQIPNDNSQNQTQLLNEIKSSIIAINKRLDKLEANYNNKTIDLNIFNENIKKLNETAQNANNNITKLSPHSLLYLVFFVILIISSIIFIGHMWDVPAQTNAINQYIYEKTFKEQHLNHK